MYELRNKEPRQAQRYKWNLRRQNKNNYKGQWVFSGRAGAGDGLNTGSRWEG